MRNLLSTAAFMLMLAAAPALALEAMEAGGIRYMSGGIGEEELEELKAMEGQFNLKIVMAMKNGEYVSDEPVVIRDAGGATVLEAVSDGPLFYAKLPPGRYAAAAGGKSGQVSVTETALTTAHFRW